MFHRKLNGVDLHSPSNIEVQNESGAAIPLLKVVKFTGIDGSSGLPLIAPVDSFNDEPVGVMPEVLDDTEEGVIVGINFIFEIDTSMFEVGDSLYSDVSGNLTTTESNLKIGSVLVKSTTVGAIFVDPVKSAPDAGSVEVHNDVSSAGSGVIISAIERALINSNFSILNGSLLSSHISGCQITINAGDSSLFDLGAGEIYITELNGPVGSTGVVVPIAPQTGVAHAAGPVSRISLDSVGDLSVVAFTGQLTEKEKMAGEVQIKIIGHLGGLESSPITSTATTISARFGISPPANAKMFGDGIQARGGLGLILNANLTVGRRAGTQFDPLAPNFHVDPLDEFLETLSLNSAFTFFHSWMGNDINSLNFNAPLTDINPANWDDPTISPGVGSTPTSTLSGNEAQNFSVHESVNDGGVTTFGIQYGRVKYGTLSAAVVGAVSEMLDRDNAIFVKGTAFRGSISVARAETDLQANATFTAPTSRSIETL